MGLLTQTIINGLLIGGVYALIAVGLTMIFGVMKIVNFAQGEFLMLGMYFTWVLSRIFTGVNPYLMIIPVAAIMFCFGIAVFKLSVSHVIGKGDTSYILLTVGLSYFLQNMAQLIWSPNPVSLQTAYKTMAFNFAGLTIPYTKLIAFAIAIVFVIFVNFFLAKTDIGRAMRATSENGTVAQMLGINTRVMFMVAFGLGVMFAAIAGCILAPVYAIYPRIGTVFSTTVFACVVIGGLGNIKGAFIGGIIIGLIEALSGTYIALNLAPISVFLILISVMMFKPNGIMGGGMRKA